MTGRSNTTGGGERRSGPVVGGPDRGQLVLVAAGVVAVALLAMLLAFAAVDAGTGAPDRTSTVDGERVRAALERAVANATESVPRNHRTSERAVRDRVDRTLAGDVTRLREEWAAAGAAVSVSRNRSVAATRARTACPSGPNRQFGSCRADAGVVTQRRAGEWHVVAVVWDVRVTSERRHLTVTVTVRPTG